MKMFIKKLFLLTALIAGLVITPGLKAQTFTTFYSFTNGTDGGNPEYGSLILAGNTMYGTTYGGGNAGNGTVFAINTNGMGFTNLYSFTATAYNNNTGGQTNSDGANPAAGLILSGNTLYGTTGYGGINARGTVFAINTDGTGFTNLHTFIGYPSDGASPTAGLILAGSTFYGTALYGGTNGTGTVFALNTNGMGFTNLYNFKVQNYDSAIGTSTNSDGAYPVAGLILSGKTLYGTAEYGGISGVGTVFAVNIDGTGFTNLHSFTYGLDGAFPYAGLVLSGNNLYGTASAGGSLNKGTVFALNTNGTGFTTLHDFTNVLDGYYPKAGLVLSGNTFYGTANGGGHYNSGTVFALNTNGMGITNLYNFAPYVYDPPVFLSTNSSGAHPEAGLLLSGNTLYGTAYDGGISGYGTVFSLALGSASISPPLLTILPSGTNVVLAWTNTASGFNLLFTTNLVPPAIWSTNSTAPVVINGQNTVTNPISGTQKFYRLSQ
ncbi:MAG: choice-of-anchor tandem repeat GloVer-containing protein [Verrucomicrobiia bacterium]